MAAGRETTRPPKATVTSEPATDEGLVEEFEAERPGRKLTGLPAAVVTALGVAIAVLAVYWVLDPISAGVYRSAFLALALLMTFLVFGSTDRDST